MPIRNKSMLSGHPWRMPHLTGMRSDREPLRFSWAERLLRKIWIHFNRISGIPNFEAVERIYS